jgi:hypothetical protein
VLISSAGQLAPGKLSATNNDADRVRGWAFFMPLRVCPGSGSLDIGSTDQDVLGGIPSYDKDDIAAKKNDGIRREPKGFMRFKIASKPQQRFTPCALVPKCRSSLNGEQHDRPANQR